jgi:hypothetical protein
VSLQDDIKADLEEINRRVAANTEAHKIIYALEQKQRLERIATAVLGSMINKRADYHSYEYVCENAVNCARALIAEIDKEPK